MKQRRQIHHECLSHLSADFRCRLIGWIPSKDLQVNQASCFKLPAYLYATKQFTPLPQRSLLPLKALYDKYDDSIQPRMHLLECFFSISFLSERWISLSFRLTFCCWLGVSWRKLHILFRALILMNVSIEQYSDVSCFRKWETRVLVIAWVHAYWEETKLNSLQSSSVGSRIWLHKVMCWILNFICDFKVAQSIHGAVLGNLPKHCDKDGWILFRKYSCTVPNTQKSDSWDIFICKNLYCCTAEFWNNRFFCCCCFCFAVVV